MVAGPRPAGCVVSSFNTAQGTNGGAVRLRSPSTVDTCSSVSTCFRASPSMRSVCRLTISLLAVYFFSSKAAICSSSLLAALVAILLEPIFISAVYFLSRILEHSLGHYIFLDIFYCAHSVSRNHSIHLCHCREQEWDHVLITRH